MWKASLRAVMLSLLLLLGMVPAAVGYAEGQNMVSNAGFEEGQADVLQGWTQDVWVSGSETTQFALDRENTRSGNGAASIYNKQPNHAKWIQTIQVQPNTYYQITGWVKVAEAGAGASGANIFVLGVNGTFPEYSDTSGEWKPLSFYGQTGPDQKELKLAVGLGGYGSLNTGQAWFDDLSMVQLSAVPESVEVISFIPSDTSGEAAAADQEVDPKKISAFPVLSVSALFGMLFLILYKRKLRQPLALNGSRSDNYNQNLLYTVLAVAFAFRICIAIMIPGYIPDLNTFMFWANHAYENGIANFYQEGMFADYPPGYLYVLYVLGAIKSLLGLDPASDGARLLFKLPAIVADIATGWLIYQFSKKKLGYSAAAGLAMLYVWNPAIWVNSSAWGQVDSIFALVLVLAIRGIAESRFERGSIWFAIAVLIKPQAFIFTPVLLLAFWHKKEWKRTAMGILYGLAAYLVLAIPFFWNNGGIMGMIDLYKTTLSSYPYATLNAFNLYALTGGNWAALDRTWLGLSYGTWGNIGIGFAVIMAVWLSLRGPHKRDLSKSYYIAFVLITIVFILSAKMHERYMFPAIVLAIFAYIAAQDRRILHVLLGFSITGFVNVGYVLAFSEVNQHPFGDGIVILCSIANVALLIYMLYIGYDIYIRDRRLPVQPITAEELREVDTQLLKEVHPATAAEVREGSPSKLRLQKKDWLWMSVITALYAVVALSNLGSTQSLDSGWKAESVGQSFYVDFGQSVQLERINSFGGVGTGKYKVEFGETPDAWVSPIEVEQTVGDNLKWASQNVMLQARYAKVTVVSTGFSMQEMAFYQQGSKEPLPIQTVQEVEASANASASSSASRLFDEQSHVSYQANYMNGTYFDEIYHARTAYEHLEGLKAYENTHPPLGKLLIAMGIKLFGLSPFGWRIVGTLFGVAMIPLLYLFALRLFRRTGYAVAAALLLAAEFMHFTQTRIATIDVYGVFFIMLMFYFMYRYYSMSFYQDTLRKTLVPLFWAGLFFGIGVASKWIVIYGGAGLAVMLAIVLFERYKQYAAAKRALAGNVKQKAEAEAYRRVVRAFPRYTILTLASCLIFFVLIPLVIYALSYIPVLSVEGDNYTLTRLVDYQKHMFEYHSQLVATHPYSSQWWEWPLMKRPVWYYSGKNLADPTDISAISAFGNPLIWWTGLFAVIGALYMSLKRKDKKMYVVWIAYLSQYLPWMLVPRLTFIYHYFAMVPFMILAIVYMFKLIEEKRPERRWVRYVYIGAAVLLFILFYPVLSGMEVNKEYVAYTLRWFQSWVFFS